MLRGAGWVVSMKVVMQLTWALCAWVGMETE